MHVGTRVYYDAIAAYLANFERVHYEMVRPATTNDPGLAEKTRLWGGVNSANAAFVADALHLVPQKQALTYQPHWENHDADVVDVVAGMNIANLRAQLAAAHQMDKVDPRIARLVVQAGMRLLPLNIGLSALSPWHNRRHKAVVTDRNKVALAAAGDAVSCHPDINLALLWGSVHVHGIRTGLHRLGYRTIRVSWLRAVPLRQLAELA